MVPEYQDQVLRSVLENIGELSQGNRRALIGRVKRYVKVPGFRNSSVAPLPMKVKGAIKAFEKHPDFTALCLSSWAEVHQELAKQVFDFLKAREWELLPLEADRAKLPGFLITWPKAETYDVLEEAFALEHPDDEYDENDFRLMVIWLAGRLPYQMGGEELEEQE